MKRLKYKHSLLFFSSILIITFLGICFFGCGGGGGDGGDVNTLTITWDAPNTNADGTPITDLAGYIVYYGTTTNQYTDFIDVGYNSSIELGGLPLGPVFVAITAYDTSGYESDYSEELSLMIE